MTGHDWQRKRLLQGFGIVHHGRGNEVEESGVIVVGPEGIEPSTEGL